jgi:hypothetical protein
VAALASVDGLAALASGEVDTRAALASADADTRPLRQMTAPVAALS